MCMLTVEGGRPLRLLNTHLSAFAREDDTMTRQVEALRERLEMDEGPTLLAGDLNLLPPEDDPTRLQGHSGRFPVPSPLRLLEEASQAALPGYEAAHDPARWGTYLPPGASCADRTIDHAFLKGDLRLLHDEIPESELGLSDHRPILLDLQIGESP